ncbi:Endoglucanase 3 [Hordeum vulgare]|nr:Endoglucanase 3 [Hordeum vulgare]
MCVQRPDEPLRDYVTRWTELCNSYEGVHEVQAIQYFIYGCRDGTLLKHKLMCSDPTSLTVLMAKADKYAMADSAMRVKVTASDKVVPTPATPKPAGDNGGGQNNNKRKADQLDSRSNNKLVASVEGEASTSQAGSQQKQPSKSNWLPRQTFEKLVDAPCKIHSGVIDLGLELINPIIEPREVLPNVIGINPVLVGELRDHHVVGVESTLHHPLALEDLLLHSFEPRLHASVFLGTSTSRMCNIPSRISID